MITAKEVRAYLNMQSKEQQWSSIIGNIEYQIQNAAMLGIRKIKVLIVDLELRRKVIDYLKNNDYIAYEDVIFGIEYSKNCDGIIIEW